MANIQIDFSQTVGRMKPLHGVNSGPKTKVFTYNSTPYFLEAGLPFSRLHDVEYPYGSGEFVDIHCVFPDFDADETNPASYNFALTDLYIEAILAAGTKVIYRLGESIEHAPVKRHVHPPKDFAKWARIAEHIILHYTEKYGAEHFPYWEIWNEPDNGASCWGGTENDFCDFFETAAVYLKSRFPAYRIGGPALTGNLAWGERFLREMQKRNVPLDFFSWHTYTDDPSVLRIRAEQCRSIMDDCGYTDAEMLLDEWNYMEDWRNQAPSYRKLVAMHGAAFCAASLIEMQHSPTDAAAYFEADVIKEWCGIFEVEDMAIGLNNNGKLRPRKPFYAFRGFNKLYRTGMERFSKSDTAGVFVCAADTGAMIAVYGAENMNEITFDLTGLPSGKTLIFRRTNEADTLAELLRFRITNDTCTVTLPAADDEILEIEIE